MARKNWPITLTPGDGTKMETRAIRRHGRWALVAPTGLWRKDEANTPPVKNSGERDFAELKVFVAAIKKAEGRSPVRMDRDVGYLIASHEICLRLEAAAALELRAAGWLTPFAQEWLRLATWFLTKAEADDSTVTGVKPTTTVAARNAERIAALQLRLAPEKRGQPVPRRMMVNHPRGDAWSQAEDRILVQWLSVRGDGFRKPLSPEMEAMMLAKLNNRTKVSVRQRVVRLNRLLFRGLHNRQVPECFLEAKEALRIAPQMAQNGLYARFALGARPRVPGPHREPAKQSFEALLQRIDELENEVKELRERLSVR